jgi:hypothetical protein
MLFFAAHMILRRLCVAQDKTIEATRRLGVAACFCRALLCACKIVRAIRHLGVATCTCFAAVIY